MAGVTPLASIHPPRPKARGRRVATKSTAQPITRAGSTFNYHVTARRAAAGVFVLVHAQ